MNAGYFEVMICYPVSSLWWFQGSGVPILEEEVQHHTIGSLAYPDLILTEIIKYITVTICVVSGQINNWIGDKTMKSAFVLVWPTHSRKHKGLVLGLCAKVVNNDILINTVNLNSINSMGSGNKLLHVVYCWQVQEWSSLLAATRTVWWRWNLLRNKQRVETQKLLDKNPKIEPHRWADCPSWDLSILHFLTIQNQATEM